MTRQTSIHAYLPRKGDTSGMWKHNIHIEVPGRLSLDECVERVMAELLLNYREELESHGGKELEVTVDYSEHLAIGQAYDWHGLIAKRMEEKTNEH